MASTYTLKSQSYQGRYLYIYCKQTKDISTNTSKIDWTLTATGGESTYYTTGPTTVKINGEQVYYKDQVSWSKYTFPAAPGSVSGSLTVEHGDDGKLSIPVSITTSIYTGVLETKNGTWTLDANERFATIESAPNFNDEENPTITYSNPAGNSVTSLRACISLDGSKADIEYRDISKTGTSYTFNLTNAERDVLRAATTDANSRKVKFYVRSEIGESYKGSNLSRTLTIKNPKPTISPTITDTNSTTVALTGDSSKLVKYYSNAAITIGAAAVKKATLTSKKVTCGSKSRTSDGTINAVESGSFVFTATDSRGNTTEKTVTPSFVEYIKLTCNLGNNMPDGDGNMTVKATGNYFNGSFGAKSNSLNVYYRYKTAGGSYSSWAAMTVTKSGNTYSATANLTGLDYQTAYVFQAYAVDKLATVYSSEKTGKATPIFDWGENDFAFNVPVTINGAFVRAKRCVVGQNGNSDANPWYKFASVTATQASEDMRISFKVTFGYGSITRFAIINANIRTANANGANNFQRLEFESDTGVDSSNFILAHSGTGAGAVYELWVKLTAYRFCFFEVLSESSRMAFIDRWVLYNQVSLGYAAEPTSGYTKVAATRPYLINNYPVGSYYISANDTSPAELFGGTWHRIESRFLWAAPASSTLGATAGEMTHTLTDSEIPSHRHDGLFYTGNNQTIGLNKSSIGYTLTYASNGGNGKNEIYTGSTGGGSAHNNMPPYVNVAIWRRTA